MLVLALRHHTYPRVSPLPTDTLSKHLTDTSPKTGLNIYRTSLPKDRLHHPNTSIWALVYAQHSGLPTRPYQPW